MTYQMKHWPELWRSLIIALISAAMAVGSGIDPAGAHDWKIYVGSLVVGFLHYGGAAALAFFTKEDPPAQPLT